MFRRYLTIMSLGTLLLISPLAPGLLILWQGDELESLAEIIDTQSDENVLYGTAVHANELEHRLSLIASRHPDIVAMGSSRMEQFRQPYFNRSFVCLCTVMGSIEDAAPLISEMLKRHKPEFVIFGLDYWWFTKLPQGRNVHPIRANANTLTLQKILQPLNWVMAGRMTMSEASDVVTGGHPNQTLPGYRPVGLAAKIQGRGYRFDGSAMHSELLFADRPASPTQDIAKVLEKIRRGDPLYPHDAGFDPTKVGIFVDAVRRLSEEGVTVLVIVPPMLGAVVDTFSRTPAFSYVDEIRGALQQLDVTVHDFHDIRQIGSNDCEFIDDRHAGDVGNMRILLGIGTVAKPMDKLPWDQDIVSGFVERFSGRALAAFSPKKYSGTEGDFLRLGCEKDKIS